MREDDTLHNLPAPFLLTAVSQETPRLKTYVFQGGLGGRPGQFVMAWLPGVDEKPLSLMLDDPLTLAVAAVGEFTRVMHRLQPGASVWMRGPFGRSFTIQGRRLLLVAGGYGVAPIYFLACRARQAGCDVSVVLGARTASELVLGTRFLDLGCQVHTCTDDGSEGNPMLADQAAAGLLERRPYEALYACGPEGMLEAVVALARRRGLPAQISREAYMRCGFGVCGSCTCGDQLVCRDGPVFDLVP